MNTAWDAWGHGRELKCKIERVYGGGRLNLLVRLLLNHVDQRMLI